MHLAIEWLPETRPAPQLLILLHDDGAAGGAQMLPLAIALRDAFAQAAIVAPDAPHGSGDGPVRQWMPDDDLDAAMAELLAFVRGTQRRLGIGQAATALAGLGRGAMLALELASRSDGLAGRVLAFGGRYRTLPDTAPQRTTLHLLHGGADPVTDAAHARAALQHLGVLHGDATLDIAQGVGHELHPALIDSALVRLRNHIPHRTWRAALGGVSDLPDAACDRPS